MSEKNLYLDIKNIKTSILLSFFLLRLIPIIFKAFSAFFSHISSLKELSNSFIFSAIFCKTFLVLNPTFSSPKISLNILRISCFQACEEMDDISEEDNSGAGHLGTVEYNSSTLYRYATVNVRELAKNLGQLTPDAVRGFLESFVQAMPTGKQNTFANRTCPDFVYVALRTDQPVNLCGAFEKPVVCREGGYFEASQKAFWAYTEKLYENYASEPQSVWGFGDGFTDKMNFPQILEGVYSAVKEKLSEREAK